MVMRGSPSRRLVGNPLGGVLREAARTARKPTRTTGRTPQAPPDETAAEGEVPAPRREDARRVLAAVVESDEQGRAHWRFPGELRAVPVLSAVVVGAVAVPVVQDVTVAGAVVQLWALDGSPVPAGVAVHLTAVPPS